MPCPDYLASLALLHGLAGAREDTVLRREVLVDAHLIDRFQCRVGPLAHHVEPETKEGFKPRLLVDLQRVPRLEGGKLRDELPAVGDEGAGAERGEVEEFMEASNQLGSSGVVHAQFDEGGMDLEGAEYPEVAQTFRVLTDPSHGERVVLTGGGGLAPALHIDLHAAGDADHGSVVNGGRSNRAGGGGERSDQDDEQDERRGRGDKGALAIQDRGEGCAHHVTSCEGRARP